MENFEISSDVYLTAGDIISTKLLVIVIFPCIDREPEFIAPSTLLMSTGFFNRTLINSLNGENPGKLI